MNNKKTSLIIIIFGYLLAYILGTMGYLLADGGTVIKLIFFDLVSFLIIYVLSILFNNTSFYDPYWSTTPFIMILLVMIMEDNLWNLQNIVFLALLFLYSLRLGFNWLKGFKNLRSEDWRYKKYRIEKPRYFQAINFFGLQLMPTILVFFGILPGVYFIVFSSEYNNLYLIGYLVMFCGVLLSFEADRELISFKEKEGNGNQILNTGLWKYSRHPNYLGEMLLWTGIYALYMAIDATKWYIFIIGSLLIDLLFIFISVPLIETHNKEKRPDYTLYIKETSMILLLPKKRGK